MCISVLIIFRFDYTDLELFEIKVSKIGLIKFLIFQIFTIL